jgi:hypothetical protein
MLQRYYDASAIKMSLRRLRLKPTDNLVKNLLSQPSGPAGLSCLRQYVYGNQKTSYF